MKNPEELWLKYWSLIALHKHDPVQELETRKAFYAGMYTVIYELSCNAVLGEEEACKRLDGFVTDVRDTMLKDMNPNTTPQ